jgi:hypothetical protein
MNGQIRKKRFGKREGILFLLFLIMLPISWILHDNYGGYTDELIEIETAAVNAKYIAQKLPFLSFLTDLRLPIYNEPEVLPKLLAYDNRAYGTAVMMPTILVNRLPGVSLNLSQLLNFRRFYIFLNYWLAGLIFCYVLCLRSRSWLVPLAGFFVYFLTPRFFAESFYNCKDLIFFSWFLISLCGLAWYQYRRSRIGLALFAVAFGLAVNTRYYGAILGIMLIGLWAANFTSDRASQRNETVPVLLAGIGALLSFYLFTPLIWELDFGAIVGGFQRISTLPTIGDAELFMGRLVAPRDVWYYIPVWIGITIPVLYLVFWFFGSIDSIRSIRQLRERTDFEKRVLRFDLACLITLIVVLLLVILVKATFYHAWRHTYFLYALMLPLIVRGFENAAGLFTEKTELTLRQGIVVGLCLISFANTSLWMVRNHPLDFVYFNEIGRHFATSFSRDYWGVGSKNCILTLAGMIPEGRQAQLGVNADLTYGSAEFTLIRLPESIQAKFKPVWQNHNADYLCYSYKNAPGNNFAIEGFIQIQALQVDGFDVVGIYQKKTD